MIKTDYKPRKLSKPIFSDKKTVSYAPVIMTVVAIALILWGMSQLIFNPDEVFNPEEVFNADRNSLDLELADGKAHESVENVQKTEKRRFELPLNLGGEAQLPNVQKPATSPADDKESSESDSDNANESEPQDNATASLEWKSSRIKSGDSTARVFSRYNLSATDLHNIMQLGSQTKTLEKVQAGHIFEYAQDSTGKLQGIRYHMDRLNTLEVLRTGSTWQATTHTKEVEIRQASASGVINSSLFLAGKNAGLSDSLVMELAGIFGWDIDFILDIREGDSFTVLFEEKYLEGEKYANGDILAAEFVNRGKSFKAVKYTDSKGNSEYFTPEGLNMRKAFLRAPLDFSYVSSSFNPKRFHPVLKRVKAHRGIDYKAPVGTPVKAAGDGKVIRSGYDKYNGHHVFIQHGQTYTTKYLHFQKRKVKVGQRVKQGQVIGYLGSSGMVTGAHLHYEFLVNGVHRNPRTVKLPVAEPVDEAERARFYELSAPLISQLEIHSSHSQFSVAEAQ